MEPKQNPPPNYGFQTGPPAYDQHQNFPQHPEHPQGQHGPQVVTGKLFLSWKYVKTKLNIHSDNNECIRSGSSNNALSIVQTANFITR